MKKKYKLTLIELLISMAIFSIMMSLLIKSFQLASDVSSNSESTIRVLEKSQLSLSLMSSELKQALTRNSTTWINTNTKGDYELFDKSLNFFIDVDNKDLRFFIPSATERKIYAIQYKHDSSKGLLRFEKELNSNFPSDYSQYYNVMSSSLADTNNLIAYVGLEEGSPKSPPDLSADGSITGDVIIPEDEISAMSLSYSLDELDDPELKKGEKPDYISISLSVKDAKTSQAARSFSRKISLNGSY